MLEKIIQIFFPLLCVMTILGDVPDVLAIILFQIAVNTLTDVNKTTLITTEQPKQLQIIHSINFWQ